MYETSGVTEDSMFSGIVISLSSVPLSLILLLAKSTGD